MSELSFKILFFRYYDRKIADGTTTFFETGISKKDFTRLCTEPGFVFDDQTISRASNAMKLTAEESKELLDAAKRDRKED